MLLHLENVLIGESFYFFEIINDGFDFKCASERNIFPCNIYRSLSVGNYEYYIMAS